MDQAEDESENTFVVIGTALSPYEEDEALKKPITLREQSVKDSKGRARFHGAFTGGFSAGYFNTVGSKEGFTPSVFVSSKEKKHDSQTQRPEDFMDDEDFGEHGIAPKLVSATDDFISGNRKRKDGTDPLESLIVPARTSIGIKLLRQLGWRDGQGIGPRFQRKKKQSAFQTKKTYGCALPSPDSEESSDDDEFIPQNVTFAPKDVNPISFQAKDDLHGLGYSGINPRSALGSAGFNLFEDEGKHQRKGCGRYGSEKGKHGITGQAFRVGEYEDEDDMDVYTVDSMSKYDKVLDGPSDNNYGWTAPKYKGLSSAPVGYIGTVLEGFKLSKQSLKPKKYFPPPELPRKFKPFHVKETEKKKEDVLAVEKTHMNANVRRNLLGEVDSVFELISSSDKAKMEAAKTQTIEETNSTHYTSSRFDKSSDNSREQSEAKDKRKESLFKGVPSFKPFARDAAKQARYEKYLENKMKSNKDDIPLGSMTEWERQKENEEFARSAQLYKPMSALMASRFTTAKYDDQDDKVEIPPEDLADKSDQKKAAEMNLFGKLTRERYEWHPDRVLCKRFNVANPYPDSTIVGVPKVKRDKFSIFNFLNNPTASEIEGLQENEKETDMEAIEENKTAENKAPKNVAKFKPLAILASDDHNLQSLTTSASNEGNIMEQQTSQSSKEMEVTGPAIKERPSMDIFKAIFSDSDDESSTDSDKEEATEKSNRIEGNEHHGSGTHALASIFGKQSATILTENTTAQGTIPIQSLEERLSPKPQERIDTKAKNQIEYSRTSSDAINPLQSNFLVQKGEGSSGSTKESLPQPPGSYIAVTDEDAVWTERVLSSDEDKRKKKKHSKHKAKKKKSKHKKQKKKVKKEKKKKKKRKAKKEVIVVSSSSSSSGSEADDDTTSEEENVDRKIFNKLKTVSTQKRPTAADFM